ncbi:hypothetical protein IEN85_22980 [Pelagicoccus sp. NFK12]|uniref:B box-type domain-containing protein n=1 Tax=Pelagicoccus enzymogenes TaxID=2773457 RepID=A0A927IHK3_9BACT|nr:hypothetical protein [Pelagicoccus enzymogenes]MBD5782382.1 hypothetical protein [Pelagicoccus enzymogenes]
MSEASKSPEVQPLTPSPELEGNPVLACRSHPSVKAEAACKHCDAPICNTCAFTYPNGLVLCPSCASAKPEVMTPKRIQGRRMSYIMAWIATFFFIVIFGGYTAPLFDTMTEDEYETLAGFLIIFLVLAPAVAGLSFGIGSLNKRRGNPVSILVPPIWNGILIGMFVLLTIIGLFAY